MVTVVDNEPMGVDLGASSYLIKPVDRDRLAVLVEQYGSARPSGENAAATPELSDSQLKATATTDVAGSEEV